MVVVATQAAAASGSGTGRVVRIAIGLLTLGSGCVQLSIAARCIRTAARVQVVACDAGPCQRPIVFGTPDVLSHHVNLHRLLTIHAVIDAAQQMVVPAQRLSVGIALRGGSEIEFAGFAVEWTVIPRPDHEPLPAHA